MTELDTLLNMLSNSDWSIRKDAVDKLAYFVDDRVTKALMQMLHDPQRPVRIAAVRALYPSSPLSAVPDLIACLNDRDIFSYVVDTLYGIAMTHDIELPGIRDLLNSSDRLLRMAGAYILSERGGVEAIPGLIDLVRIGITGDKHEFERAVKCLTRIGAPAVPALIEVFVENDEVLSRMAIAVFARLRDTRAVAPLRAVLEDMTSESEVQFDASEALTQIGTPEALEAVARWKARTS